MPSAPVRIKICGVTCLHDAEAAVAAGADMLGLIFAPSSVRRVEVETARAIAAAVRGRVETVAVFQDAPADAINATVAHIGCDFVQLHGQEAPALAAVVIRPVIRAVVVTAATVENGVRPWVQAKNVAHLLFDRPKAQPEAGWETQLDRLWRAVTSETDRFPGSFVAGGLSAENVPEVIRRWRPYGVDVASGVESAPGRKDAGRMQAFCRAVRQALEPV
ncbi:phosphoribosylanthranilate isomerase [Chloracidobacterium sp. MS 40/45]|uniref:phosphoribosylanthranilate isomerase n=1 Tax=Chloracidobacterium aggregatum TaxID=2851959 RepID=UPI001B8D61DE|nr:phosphoribosylanthranilate isomerase [Chloracidobacterium aggregatum]QUW01541.1 phosphoribosylanthranilate isomerase [Chloracidobacterium sp. MS 40/45]